MEYTQEQLESMSDHELDILTRDGDELYWPTSNWGDCGKLIDEINVSPATIEFDDDILIYHLNGAKLAVNHVNIKRAITIVYILVKQDERL